MRKIRVIILFLSFIGIVSCTKNEEIFFNESNKLIGHWINPSTDNYSEPTTFERANALNDNGYGFIFKTEKIFIERKNAGWCGTPPISYDNFEGTWKRKDSIINITSKFWGGTEQQKWKIISLNEEHLTISRIEIYNE